jgi:hypothetical protein
VCDLERNGLFFCNDKNGRHFLQQCKKWIAALPLVAWHYGGGSVMRDLKSGGFTCNDNHSVIARNTPFSSGREPNRADELILLNRFLNAK